MTRGLRIRLFLMGIFIAWCSSRAATWVTIDVPGARGTYVTGINAAGDTIGTYLDADWTSHGFLLSAGIFTDIDFPGVTFTEPTGINDSGVISGVYGDGIADHGFLFDDVSFTTLDFPGALMTLANGLNNAGDVVGSYRDAQGRRGGFKWSNGTFVPIEIPRHRVTGLQDINNHDDLVGTYKNKKLHAHFPFLLDSDGNYRLLKIDGIPISMNDNRILVGNATPQPPVRGFRFNVNTKVFTYVNFPHASNTYCGGINNAGVIVGSYSDETGYHGFARRP